MAKHLEISTQITEAPKATEAELLNGTLRLSIAVQHCGEDILRIFHVGPEGQQKILNALTGLHIPTVETPKDL